MWDMTKTRTSILVFLQLGKNGLKPALQLKNDRYINFTGRVFKIIYTYSILDVVYFRYIVLIVQQKNPKAVVNAITLLQSNSQSPSPKYMCEHSDEFLDLQSAPTSKSSTPVSPLTFSPLTLIAERNPFSLKASQPTPDNQASIYLFYFANI